MADIIQLRRDTAANWTSNNPTLANGEIGFETDTDKAKIGDGTTAWTTLGYWIDGSAGGISNVVEDTSPQLGGTLDANGNIIDMGTNNITDTAVGQWNTAYGWGDHSTEGYLTTVALNGISDVTITTPADNEVLAYNGAGAWINQTAAEAGLAEASHTHATTDITSGTFADARIAESNVTQHQAALSITESQISDLGTYLTDITGQSIKNLSDVYTTMSPIDGQVLTYDTTNGWQAETPASGVTDHTLLSNIGTNTHAQIDSHIADSTLHFTQASISITESQISDLGSYLTSVAINDVTDITITSPADNEVLAYNGAGAWINQTAAEAGLAAASHTHTASDITDFDTEVSNNASVTANTAKVSCTTANVTAAGALMDSEVTNLAQVKAFNSADYATAAQGTLADSALQDITGQSIKNLSDVLSSMTPSDGQVLTYDTTNGWQAETPTSGGLSNIVEDTTPQLGGTLDANGNSIDMGTNNITDTKVGQWDTAYGWGNHASSGYITGNQTITLSGDASGSGTTAITVTVADDSHNHVISNIDNLQTTLDGKAASDVGQGEHTIYVPANAMVTRDTNGAAYIAEELITNDVMSYGFEFDPSTDEGVQFAFSLPKSWNAGTITAQYVWTTSATAGTGSVVWSLRAKSITDNEDQDSSAWGTSINVTDTFLANNDIHVSSESSAITISSAGDDELQQFEIRRLATNGSDTYTEDARLLGVKLKYTTNAATDD